ncbi:TetR/AcrR family transcriptional regulator [Xylophilus sp.]|uniref:TetR/AcrR family transcriptional regulator n=1 Tax=Xylophilus sp. TaxID=2653893 RepID=UPI0013BE1901|nr:TetR/AcrR family transcriptional regulator [Xylophilus sp.]KAF1047781.1 MAG: HTH-type transcriptional repressor ComR [Xylophilus sp.]
MAGIRQFDEDAALAAALEVFRRQGLAATSMLDLAQATGVQRGSLYHAYGDKKALFLRAFDLYEARFLQSVEASLAGDDAGDVLHRFFESAIAHMTAGSPSQGCLTTKTATDGSTGSAPVHARLQALVDRLGRLVTAALERPAIRRQLTLDARAAASVVITFTRGLAVMERIHGDTKALRLAAGALTAALVRRPPQRGRSSKTCPPAGASSA